MARTYRRKPLSTFRKPRTQSVRLMEQVALDQILEATLPASNRLKVRANPHSSAIPSAWDDIHFASYVRWNYR